MSKQDPAIKYPGQRAAMDGNTAVIMCERESSDAAGAYPITPSTQMGEYWAEAAAQGHVNVSGRPLIFIEPEGEHAAAAVTAGLAMTGLRAANFSSGQGIAYMHESLYAAVGKRLTYVLNIGARAMTKATLNVHAGHDDYHCVDDTGFFQLFAEPYVMTQGGPLQSTVSVLYLMYDEGFKWWNLGTASAVAFVLFLIVVAVTKGLMWFASRQTRGQS